MADNKAVISESRASRYKRIMGRVRHHVVREERENERLRGATSFKLVNWAKKYDDWFLDPILGMISPTFGDVVSAAAVLPALYVAVFKIKSFRLAVAIVFVTIIDILVGLIPGIGDIVDAFHKSNKKAGRWVSGYLDNDSKTIREVNRYVLWGGLFIFAILVLIVAFFALIVRFIIWIGSLIW